MQTFIKLNERDNVAIVVKAMEKGTELMPGVVTRSEKGCVVASSDGVVAVPASLAIIARRRQIV